MRFRQFCGFCLGLLGTWFMWQVGVGLAHFIHATLEASIPAVLTEPEVTMRLMSAVAAFLAGRIHFPAIVDTVRRVIDADAPSAPASLQDIFSVDAASRAAAQHFVDQYEHA